jgi:hypothetical protein
LLHIFHPTSGTIFLIHHHSRTYFSFIVLIHHNL